MRPFALLACASALLVSGAAAEEARKPTGEPAAHVAIDEVQVALMYSGSVGGGTLKFGDKDYDFAIDGLGYGGVGISRLQAYGEVYGLRSVEEFAGAYVEARYGAAVGDASVGELWLVNPNGVQMRLHTDREGLALSLGGDAVVITFK